MIKYALPGLFTHLRLFLLLDDMMKQNPQAFYDNVQIGAIYGNFPYCLWDGGRVFPNLSHAAYETIEATISELKKRNIPLRLIFTNGQLQEQHLVDRKCNLVAAMCEDENNEIVVNSPLLEAYLREHYPHYGYISSTTKCNTAEASKQDLNTNYKYVCLDYNLNHNKKYLEALSPEEKAKTEFLCNAICPPGCPNRKEHYRLNSLSYINYNKPFFVNCGITNDTLHPDVCGYKNNISYEEIVSYYEPQGFSMFKLEGRTLPDEEVLFNCVRYMVKPEWQFEIAYTLLQQLKEKKGKNDFIC